jgi:hypothetical protein
MALVIFDAITINVSRILEGLFDELEYRSAKRALLHARKPRATRRTRTKVLNDEVMARSSKVISVRAT